MTSVFKCISKLYVNIKGQNIKSLYCEKMKCEYTVIVIHFKTINVCSLCINCFGLVY